MINKILSVALAEVGYLEKASNGNLDSKTANAGSKNFTKYARDLSPLSPGIYANGYAWCDTFVDWCFVKAFGAEKAKELIHGWSAYTPTSAGYFKNAKEWYTANPKRGDIIYFKDSKGTICHTGIVYEVDATYVYTVEGNTSSASGVVANGGAVEKKKYSRSYNRIAGYGRPKYITMEETNMEKTYNKVNECPQWARPYVQKAVDKGYIKGNEKGELQLDDLKIWCLVVMLRMTNTME